MTKRTLIWGLVRDKPKASTLSGFIAHYSSTHDLPKCTEMREQAVRVDGSIQILDEKIARIYEAAVA